MQPESPAGAPRTFRATVEYDGTAYCGFQRQRRGVPSIQAELERALSQITGQPAGVLGAGRTDTGVHALGQVVSFTIEWPDRHGEQALLRALNANLPDDIAVRALAGAAPGFHPRFDARRRTYAYHILPGPVRRPLWRQRAWRVAQPLDVARMNAAAALLIGRHDFATFGRAPIGENTIREVYAAGWVAEGDFVIFRICANAFLQRMVRSLVGSLKEVGSGKWSVDDLAEALAAGERKRSATVAPAHGLYLMSVEYDD